MLLLLPIKIVNEDIIRAFIFTEEGRPDEIKKLQ